MTRLPALRASPDRMFESLYRRHVGEVYRYALVMLGSSADAEDVTQTTFLNAYRALQRGERPRAPGSWLRVIAHNLCLQHFRHAARRPQQVQLEDEPALVVGDEEGVVLDDLIRALRQIPVNQRAALVMRELEGRPIGDIASILSVSASAVETLLFRARRSVREQLEGSLTCAQAEQAISRQLDGALSRSEKSQLRAHLRQCEPCAHLARSLRAQRRAIRSLGVLPLPGALAWGEFGTGAAMSGVTGAGAGGAASGGALVAGSLAAKLAGATLVGAVIAGAGYEAAVTHHSTTARPTAAPRTGAHVARGASAVNVTATSAATSQPIPVRLDNQRRAVVLRGAAKAHRQRGERARPRRHTAPSSTTTTSTSSAGVSHTAADPRTSAGRGRSHGRKATPAAAAQPTFHPIKPAHAAKPKPRPHPSTPAHSPQKQTGAAKPAHPVRVKPSPRPPKPRPHPVGSAPATASPGNSAEAHNATQK
jgi:RNA polymerase sigma factor (sigma-70 family)